jgi:hypothetical protein
MLLRSSALFQAEILFAVKEVSEVRGEEQDVTNILFRDIGNKGDKSPFYKYQNTD